MVGGTAFKGIFYNSKFNISLSSAFPSFSNSEVTIFCFSKYKQTLSTKLVVASKHTVSIEC